MIRKTCLVILFTITCTLGAYAQNANAIVGKWLNQSGEGQIQIYKKGDKFCGKIAWMKVPNEANGQPKLDVSNPDEALRRRPKLGLELLKDFAFDGDDVYENGTIYDPKSGKTYKCKMTLNGDELKVRGFVGVSLLGRTEKWTRVK
jgi:uncharacterized protein (DUF2147 family)